MIRCVRGAVSVTLFGLFAVGAILISPLMFLLWTPRLCHPVVRSVWRPLVFLFRIFGMVRMDYAGPRDVRGSVLVANHPSLVDVVFLVTLFPRTLYVAKHALLKDIFLSGIVRHTSLPDDERLPEVAAEYLRRGWNVLIFPEGSRTPLDSSQMREFHRGAAQVAIRNGAPIVPLGIRMSTRVLAKGQPAWDLGDRMVVYTLSRGETIEVPVGGGVVRRAAVELTDRIRGEIEKLI